LIDPFDRVALPASSWKHQSLVPKTHQYVLRRPITSRDLSSTKLCW